MNILSYAEHNLTGKIISDINKLPKHLTKFCFDRGLQVLIAPPKKAKRIVPYYKFDDGRLLHETSHFSPYFNRVYLNSEDDWDIKYEFSVLRHELGHALDYAISTKHNYYWTSSNSKVFKYGKPLDSYAATNLRERFATCFESFFREERADLKIYCAHTCHDVAKHEPEAFCFLRQLVEVGVN